jgi:hypothetical protein
MNEVGLASQTLNELSLQNKTTTNLIQIDTKFRKPHLKCKTVRGTVSVSVFGCLLPGFIPRIKNKLRLSQPTAKKISFPERSEQIRLYFFLIIYIHCFLQDVHCSSD